MATLTAASAKEFDDFKEQFENMQIDSSRIRLLKAWLSDHHLTCKQGVQVLQLLFGLGDIGVRAAVLMKPCIVDPDQIEPVLLRQGFQYDDERDDARVAMATA